MYAIKCRTLFLRYLFLIVVQLMVVQSKQQILSIGSVVKSFYNGMTSRMDESVQRTFEAAQDPVTSAMCNLRTDEHIRYYGYLAEEHNVITEDGYNLTVFRCNSNKESSGIKKAVILEHGILCSSDVFTANIPGQGLAYVLADSGFDVWLPNNRGNFYSRRHISKNPDIPGSNFWKFTWYEIGIYDYPAVFEYVIKQTKNKKVYVVAHSQATSSTIALLTEKPKYNDYIYALSLMAPVGYLKNAPATLQSLAMVRELLDPLKNTEFFPREYIGETTATVCDSITESICENFLKTIFGPSEGESNKTMVSTFFCHMPNGGSINQFLHYGQEIRYGNFGPYIDGFPFPCDFDFSKITVPISFHYSPVDTLTNPIDVNRLIPKLKSIKFVQTPNKTEFNHMDFVWGIHAVSLVYPSILQFFESYK